MLLIGVVLCVITPILNKYYFHFSIVDQICRYGLITIIGVMLATIIIMILANKGIKNLIEKYTILNSIESNLISISAHLRPANTENTVFVVLPKIKIKNNTITIKLTNLYIRSKIEKYLDSFSTALPDKYIVEDYFISQNNAELVIIYEDLKNYKPEKYTLAEYIKKIQSLDLLDLYFDKKHIVNLNDYPHWLLSGSSGSGKTYLVNQIIIGTIAKKMSFEVVIVKSKQKHTFFGS